jgi:hypothetical protein
MNIASVTFERSLLTPIVDTLSAFLTLVFWLSKLMRVQAGQQKTSVHFPIYQSTLGIFERSNLQ